MDTASVSDSTVFCGAGGVTTFVSDSRALANPMSLDLLDEGVYSSVAITGPRESSEL